MQCAVCLTTEKNMPGFSTSKFTTLNSEPDEYFIHVAKDSYIVFDLPTGTPKGNLSLIHIKDLAQAALAMTEEHKAKGK